MSVNKAVLVGNLGKDPELRHTSSGTAVCTFSLATTERFKNKQGEQQERTEWHNIVAWAGLAEICGKYLTKGSKIYVEGRIQNRSYDDRDGNKRNITEIVVNQMQMLGGRSAGEQTAHAPSGESEEAFPRLQIVQMTRSLSDLRVFKRVQNGAVSSDDRIFTF